MPANTSAKTSSSASSTKSSPGGPGPARRSETSGARWPMFAIAGAVVAALLVVALVTTQSRATRSIEHRAVSVTGTPLASFPDPPAVDPSLGSAAPTIDGAAFDGTPTRIQPGSSPMIVLFVAHWCPHCRREVPEIVTWAPTAAAKGVELRAVATATASNLPNYPPSRWLRDAKWTIPTIADDKNGTAAAAYGVSAFPYFAVVDVKGDIVRRVTGELTTAQLDELVAAALAPHGSGA